MATLTVHEYHTVEGHPEYLHTTYTHEWDGYTAREAYDARRKSLRDAGSNYEETGGSLTHRSVIYPLRPGDARIDVREVLTWTD